MHKSAMHLLEALREMVNSKEFGAQVLGVDDLNTLGFNGTLCDSVTGKEVATVYIVLDVLHKDDPKLN